MKSRQLGRSPHTKALSSDIARTSKSFNFVEREGSRRWGRKKTSRSSCQFGLRRMGRSSVGQPWDCENTFHNNGHFRFVRCRNGHSYGVKYYEVYHTLTSTLG